MTISNYIDILEIRKEDIDTFEKIQLTTHYLGLIDIDDVMYENMNTVEYNEFMREYGYVIQDPSPLEFDFDMNKISFGQYIDLFSYYTKQDLIGFSRILGLSLDDDSSKLIFGINLFNNQYNLFKEKYPLIYGSNSDDEINQEEINKIENRKERKELQDEYNKHKLQQKFSWISVVYYLADGDITKYDNIIGQNNNFVHNWLGYKLLKDKGEI